MDPVKPDVKPSNTPAAVPAGSSGQTQTVQPTPEVKTGAAPVTQVPLQALQEERGKRQEERTRAESLEAELAELKKIVAETQMQQQYQQQQQQVPQQQFDPRAELDQLWEDDPKKAVRMEIMYAMDWRDRIDASLEVQADNLARKYADFNNFRSVALGQVRSLPLNQRGGPGILEAAYFMVRGQNADQMIRQREADLLERYRRGEITAAGLAQPAGSFSAPMQEQGITLTQEQLRVADAMGLTPEQYISAMKVAR